MSGFWSNIWVMLPLLLAVGGPLAGLLIGWWIDHDHRENLEYRRRELGHVLVTNLKRYPGRAPGSPQELIVAEVVLANNAFMTLIGRLKLLFGGEVRSFYGLMTRARQEAVLRVMEAAARREYDAVGNLRLVAVDLSGQTVASGQRRNKAGLYIGIIAYGMAYRRAPGVFPPPAAPTLLEYPQ